MTAFRNTKFIERNRECANIVAVEAEEAPSADFVPCDEDELLFLDHLYTRAGVRYYGYL